MKIVHIANPVNISPSSDLYIARPITFESFRIAQNFSKKEVEGELITVQYSEDHEIIPDFFIRTNDLKRSVLNFGEFENRRKLSLIKDILERAYEHPFIHLLYKICEDSQL